MKMKKMFAILLTCLLVFSLAACGGGSKKEEAPASSAASSAAASSAEASAEEPASAPASSAAAGSDLDQQVHDYVSGVTITSTDDVTWKLAHVCTEDTAANWGAEIFKEVIERETGGHFKVEIYPNSQLGNNPEIVEGMLAGTIEAAIPNGTTFGGYSPKMQAIELPFLINDISNFDDAEKVYITSGAIDPIIEDMRNAGFEWIASYFQGMRHLTTAKTEVHKTDDLKGLKIRVQASDIQLATWNALGANAVPMAFSEVFTALQQGALDGQENPYNNIYTQGFYEVQGYIMESGHLFDIIPLVTSVTAFNALPADYQELVKKVGKDLCMLEWLKANEYDEMYKQMIIDKSAGKCKVIEMTTEERAAMKDACASVYETVRKNVGDDLVDGMINAQN